MYGSMDRSRFGNRALQGEGRLYSLKMRYFPKMQVGETRRGGAVSVTTKSQSYHQGMGANTYYRTLSTT